MRITDWSSDVCSSDLARGRRPGRGTLDRRSASGGADPQIRDGRAEACDPAGNCRWRMLYQRGDERASGGIGSRCNSDEGVAHGGRMAAPGAENLVDRGAYRPLHDRSGAAFRSEEHTSELQSLMRISYAVFCLKKKNTHHNNPNH